MWMPLLALTALAFVPAALGQAASCPDGFTLLTDSCYRVGPSRCKLADARALCADMKAELVTVETSEEMAQIKAWMQGDLPQEKPSLAYDAVWVNAGCEAKVAGRCEGDLVWQSGAAIPSDFWMAGSPRPHQTGKHPRDGVVMWSNAGWKLENRPSDYKMGIAFCEAVSDGDDCAENACLNEGLCVDGVNSYTCNCTAGFQGEDCATNVDDCAGSPCLNEGVCVDGVNSYTCDCTTGFEGEDCATNVDDCAGSPCQNGGVCVDDVASYTCDCTTGFEGQDCATSTDDCAVNPCRNGGVCVDGAGSYTCSCASHYTGTHCETGCTGGNSCCVGGICGENEGDCDTNEDCRPGLVCGSNNCVGDSFQGTDDCCEKQVCDGGNSCCANGMCGENEGDCDTNRDCRPGLVCGVNNCVGDSFQSTDDCCAEMAGCDGDNSCCGSSGGFNCGIGEGDCDSNADCQEGLVCGTNNCEGSTFQSTDDCCEQPTSQCDGGNSCCSGGNCGAGEGDCDNNSDCQTGLSCGVNNCEGDSFAGSDDCCEPSNCTGGNSCCDGDCGVGEGDCDYHSDCLPGLACGSDNCNGDSFQSTDDCCYQPPV